MRFRNEMGEQFSTYTLVTGDCAYVGVPDQRNVFDVLKAHHAEQATVFGVAREAYSRGDLVLEFRARHIRLVPAIGWNHAFVGRRRVIDDFGHRWHIRGRAVTNFETSGGIFFSFQHDAVKLKTVGAPTPSILIPELKSGLITGKTVAGNTGGVFSVLVKDRDGSLF